MSGPVILALRALLAAGLYAFLAWGLTLLWREVRQQAVLLAMRRIPAISLSVTGKDETTHVQHFKSAEVTIGRHPACECRLSDDSASAYHARLSFHHGQWWLEDLKSTNGTTLNGETVLIPTVVVSGDEIRCGKTRLVVTLGGDTLLSPTDKSDSYE